jgi:hypothetical protein
MNIVSTFLPPVDSDPAIDNLDARFSGRKSLLMAFDTLVDEKSLVTGITVGKVYGEKLDDVAVSSIGQAIINRIGAHLRLNYPDGAVMVVGIEKISRAAQRVRQALQAAPDGAAVLFVCADSRVYDEAFPELHVDFQSANQQTQ